jgi:hypothetical protein
MNLTQHLVAIVRLRTQTMEFFFVEVKLKFNFKCIGSDCCSEQSKSLQHDNVPAETFINVFAFGAVQAITRMKSKR